MLQNLVNEETEQVIQIMRLNKINFNPLNNYLKLKGLKYIFSFSW